MSEINLSHSFSFGLIKKLDIIVDNCLHLTMDQFIS